MQDGFYKPKYLDKKTGQQRISKVWWSRDPASGKRVSTGARTIEGARAWLEDRERCVNNPLYLASREAELGHWIDRVIAIKVEHSAAGTVNMYRCKLGHVSRIFGKHSPMSVITPTTIDRYIDKRREEGACNNTLVKELACLVQVCKHAKREGQYAGDISALKPIGFSSGYMPRKAHLDQGDLEKLAAVLKPHELSAVTFIVATSARLSEYLRAVRLDVNHRSWLVRLRGSKTALSARVVPVPTPFRDLLLTALPAMETKWARISRDLPRRCAKAGIPRLTPNDLRRTHATWLIEAGVHTALVAKNLGHVDSKMVERVYGHPEALATMGVMEAQIALVEKHKKASKSGSDEASAGAVAE